MEQPDIPPQNVARGKLKQREENLRGVTVPQEIGNEVKVTDMDIYNRKTDPMRC